MKRLKRQNFQGSSIRFDWRVRIQAASRSDRTNRQEQIFRENLSYHSMPFDVGGSLACWNVGTSLWMVFRERIPDIRGCGREEAEVVDSAEYKIVPCDRFEVQRTRNRVLLVPMIACPQRDLPLARALALIWGRRGGGGRGCPGWRWHGSMCFVWHAALAFDSTARGSQPSKQYLVGSFSSFDKNNHR